jgi:hypothetical protein
MRNVREATAMVGLTSVLLSATGCATIINGRNQDVSVASKPAGATVKVDSLQTTTPGTLTLKRGQDYKLVFMKDGFPERQAALDKTVSGWLAGNLLFGGLIGLVVDFISGGAYKLSPDSVDMDMATGTVKEIKKEDAKPTSPAGDVR